MPISSLMGTYRLILAIFVLLSHQGVSIFGLNPGITAVISFLLLSGFVMTALIQKNYFAAGRILPFYLDRAMRLLPQYLAYLAATLVLILAARPVSSFVQEFDFSLSKILLNVLILPLGLYMYGMENTMLIPQAWSLGLETMFYLAIPLLLVWRLRIAAFALSALVFMMAYMGLINTDVWGYRLLPGTLFIFLTGSFIYDRKIKHRRLALAVIWACAAIGLAAVKQQPSLQLPNNAEVLAGLVIGIPAVCLLRNLPNSRLDTLLGNISYGVFLNHFFLMWLFEALSFPATSPKRIVVLVLCSVVLSSITFNAIEAPAIRFRHLLRYRKST